MKLRLAAALLLTAVFWGAFPSAALAQRKLWGITGSYTPLWTTQSFSKHLYSADAVDLQGQAYRFGVTRGVTVGGDWSLLFVQRKLDGGGLFQKDVTYTTNNDVTMTGFEAEKFAVVGSVKNRVLFGIVIAAGVAVVRGHMTTSDGITVEAKDVMTLFNTSVKIQPLFRLEFGAGFVVARGFRIRASGGFDWSGLSGSVAGTYFFGDR